MDKIFNYPAFGDLDHLIFIGFMLANWFVLTLLYSFNLLTLTMSLEIVQTWIILQSCTSSGRMLQLCRVLSLLVQAGVALTRHMDRQGDSYIAQNKLFAGCISSKHGQISYHCCCMTGTTDSE